MNPSNQPEPKPYDMPELGLYEPDAQVEVGLREKLDAIRKSFLPNQVELDKLVALFHAERDAAVKAERERVFEGTSKAIHDTYFSILNGIADGLESNGKSNTAEKVRMIADKARKNMLDDIIAEARLQPPKAGEGGETI